MYDSTAVIDIEYLLPKGYFLWSELQTDDPAFAQGREFFNIDNGISFVTKQNDTTTLYIFGSTRDNFRIDSFYLKNIDLFKRFILYFNDTANKLIVSSHKNKIFLPSKQIVTGSISDDVFLGRQSRKSFIEKIPINKYYMINKDENVYLTKREFECAYLFISGLTKKEVSKELGISARTVETYILRSQEKLKSLNKCQLSQEILSSGFSDVIKNHD